MRTDRPGYIQFYPAIRCDLSCKVCFNRSIPDTEDANLRDYERVASVLIDNGIGEIDILWGEPALHSDIERVLEIS